MTNAESGVLFVGTEDGPKTGGPPPLPKLAQCRPAVIRPTETITTN